MRSAIDLLAFLSLKRPIPRTFSLREYFKNDNFPLCRSGRTICSTTAKTLQTEHPALSFSNTPWRLFSFPLPSSSRKSLSDSILPGALAIDRAGLFLSEYNYPRPALSHFTARCFDVFHGPFSLYQSFSSQPPPRMHGTLLDEGLSKLSSNHFRYCTTPLLHSLRTFSLSDFKSFTKSAGP